MLIPIRCFTCGSVTGDKWNVFCDRVKEKKKKSSEMVESSLDIEYINMDDDKKISNLSKVLS